MALPGLTVMIAVRNGEDFLGETMRSVLAQTLPPSEIVVIDDGSTDRSAAIAASFGEKVRIVKGPERGLAAARNFGFTKVSTEWVALLDHDDLWERDHLETMAAAIDADPGSDVCYSGIRQYVFDSAAGEFRAMPPLPTPVAAKMPKALMSYCAFQPSGAAVRIEAVRAVGGFDQAMLFGEDWDLWLRMVHHGSRFAYTGRPTLLYRIHGRSHSHKVLQALHYNRLIVARHIAPYLPFPQRVLHSRRIISEMESDGAIRMRSNDEPGALRLMLRSIVRHPFHEPHRYKVAAHMLLHGYPTSGH